MFGIACKTDRPVNQEDREFMDAAVMLEGARISCEAYCKIGATEQAIEQFARVLRYEAMVTRMTVHIH